MYDANWGKFWRGEKMQKITNGSILIILIILAMANNGCAPYSSQEGGSSLLQSESFQGQHVFKAGDFVSTGENFSLSEDSSSFNFDNTLGYLVVSSLGGQDNVHAHFKNGQAYSNYTFSGTMQIDSMTDGIGVTFLSGYPDEDSYYRLSRNSANSELQLSSRLGTSSCENRGSGVDTAAGGLFKFKINTEAMGHSTKIAIKVWPAFLNEPFSPQINCTDNSQARRRSGTVGMYADGSGLKRWYDLQITSSAFAEGGNILAENPGTEPETPDPVAEEDVETPVEEPQEEPTPSQPNSTIRVNSYAQLKNNLNSLASSLSESKTLVLTAGTYSGNLDLSGLKFSHEVIIMGEAPSGDGDSNFTKIQGQVNISNTRNLSLKLMKIQGGPNRVIPDNCQNCLLERLHIEGQKVDIRTQEVQSKFGIEINSTSNLTIKDSFISYMRDAALVIGSGNSNTRIEGIVSGLLGHDFIKLSGQNNNGLKIIKTWQCRTLVPYKSYIYSTPQAAHTDFYQAQGTSQVDGAIFYGNIVFKGDSPENLRDYGENAFQGIYFGAQSNHSGDVRIRHNVIASNNANGIMKGGGAKVNQAQIESNTMLRIEQGALGSAQEGSYPSINVSGAQVAKNAVARPDTRTGFGEQNGGLNINIGPKPYIDFASYDQYFAGRMYYHDSLSAMKPKAGTKLHWNYQPAEARVGAFERLKQVFVDGDHPGNLGWPVALPFTHQYNNDGGVNSSFSGRYNLDGSNR